MSDKTEGVEQEALPEIDGVSNELWELAQTLIGEAHNHGAGETNGCVAAEQSLLSAIAAVEAENARLRREFVDDREARIKISRFLEGANDRKQEKIVALDTENARLRAVVKAAIVVTVEFEKGTIDLADELIALWEAVSCLPALAPPTTTGDKP